MTGEIYLRKVFNWGRVLISGNTIRRNVKKYKVKKWWYSLTTFVSQLWYLWTTEKLTKNQTYITSNIETGKLGIMTVWIYWLTQNLFFLKTNRHHIIISVFFILWTDLRAHLLHEGNIAISKYFTYNYCK